MYYIGLVEIAWDDAKNERLKVERGLDLEDIADAIARGDLLAILPNPSRAGQVIFVVELDGYACACPAVLTESGYFLKTAYRSRKFHKRFKGGE